MLRRAEPFIDSKTAHDLGRPHECLRACRRSRSRGTSAIELHRRVKTRRRREGFARTRRSVRSAGNVNDAAKALRVRWLRELASADLVEDLC